MINRLFSCLFLHPRGLSGVAVSPLKLIMQRNNLNVSASGLRPFCLDVGFNMD